METIDKIIENIYLGIFYSWGCPIKPSGFIKETKILKLVLSHNLQLCTWEGEYSFLNQYRVLRIGSIIFPLNVAIVFISLIPSLFIGIILTILSESIIVGFLYILICLFTMYFGCLNSRGFNEFLYKDNEKFSKSLEYLKNSNFGVRKNNLLLFSFDIEKKIAIVYGENKNKEFFNEMVKEFNITDIKIKERRYTILKT